MKKTLVAAIAIATSLASTSSAEASWFARLDSAGRLIVTGIATDENSILSPITLTCADGRLTAEILTQLNTTKDELPTYSGAKIILGYKTANADKTKMGLDAEPVLLIGNALGLVSKLSAEQSQAIYTAISRGTRIDLELVHPQFDYDLTPKKIYAGGSTQAFSAMNEHCSAFE